MDDPISISSLKLTLSRLCTVPCQEADFIAVGQRAVCEATWQTKEDAVDACRTLLEACDTSDAWKKVVCDRFAGDILTLCAISSRGVERAESLCMNVAHVAQSLCKVIGPRDFHMNCLDMLINLSDDDLILPSSLDFFAVAILICLPGLNPYFTISTYEALGELATRLSARCHSAGNSIIHDPFLGFAVGFCDDLLSMTQTRLSCPQEWIFQRDCSFGFLFKLLQQLCSQASREDLVSFIDGIIQLVLKHCGEMNHILFHPYRVRMCMCDTYRLICKTQSFQNKYRKLKLSEEAIARCKTEKRNPPSQSDAMAVDRINRILGQVRSRSNDLAVIAPGCGALEDVMAVSSISWSSVTDSEFVSLAELYEEHCPNSLHLLAKWNAIKEGIWRGILFHEDLRWPLAAVSLVSSRYISSSIMPRVYSKVCLWEMNWPHIIAAFRDFPFLYESSTVSLEINTVKDSAAVIDEDTNATDKRLDSISYVGLRAFCSVYSNHKLNTEAAIPLHIECEYLECAAVKGSNFWKECLRDFYMNVTCPPSHNDADRQLSFGRAVAKSHDIISIAQLVINAIATCRDKALIGSCLRALRSFFNSIPMLHRFSLLRRLCQDCPFRQLTGFMIDYVKDLFQSGAKQLRLLGSEVYTPMPPLIDANEYSDLEKKWLQCVRPEECAAVSSCLSDEQQLFLKDLLISHAFLIFSRVNNEAFVTASIATSIPLILREFVLPKLALYQKISLSELLSSRGDDLLAVLSLVSAVGVFAEGLLGRYDEILNCIDVEQPDEQSSFSLLFDKNIVVQMLESICNNSLLPMANILKSQLGTTTSSSKGENGFLILFSIEGAIDRAHDFLKKYNY